MNVVGDERQDREPMVLVLIDPVWQEFVNKQIEDMNRYRMRMFASLSHELRTPLNCSISMLEFLETDILHIAKPTAETIPYNKITSNPQIETSGVGGGSGCGLDPNMSTTLQQVSFECERMIDSYLKPALHSSKLLLNLINDILDFVQIDSGKFKFTFVAFSLETLLQECIVLISMQARSKNIQLVVNFDPSIPKKIESDPNRIRQVLLNFLSNALKFTVKGHITVEAKLTNDPTNLVLLSVADSGIGISEQDIRNIFTMFNKVDLGNNEQLNSQGCGLGLTLSNSIAKGLAPDSVGGIQVESVAGKGSTFSFFIQNHSAFTHQSCDVIVTEDDEVYRPSSKTCKSKKSFQSPPFEQPYDGGKFLVEPLIETTIMMNTAQNLILPQSATSAYLPHSSTSINVVLTPQINPVISKSTEISSKRTIAQSETVLARITHSKDIAMVKQVLNDGGRCSCVQILAADDNEFNLFVVQTIFRKAAMQAEYACNGEIAYQKVLERRASNKCCPDYRIIFMDIEMPILNGYQTSQLIHEYYSAQDELFKKPYIVACTAMVGEDERQLAKLHFMDDYITKPIQTVVLEQVLVKFVAYFLKASLKNRDTHIQQQ